MKALVFDRVGEASEVLQLRDVPAPLLQPGQVLVALEASPIHPADFAFVRGSYRVKPSFPQVAGLSGAGRVVRVGAGVVLAVGARVAFRWPGAWAELSAVPIERTFLVPDNVAIDSAAQFALNPITAWGLLEMARVQSGEWIALTAATSSVAALLSALAHERGIHVIGVARPGSLAGLAPSVQRVSETEAELALRVRELTLGQGLAALIDCVGGPLVGALFPALRQGATVVAYGTLSPEPTPVHNAMLVYGNLTWQGFGIDRWCASLTPADTLRMTDGLWGGIGGGRLPLPVQDHFSVSDFGAGLSKAIAGGPGKVLFHADATVSNV